MVGRRFHVGDPLDAAARRAWPHMLRRQRDKVARVALKLAGGDIQRALDGLAKLARRPDRIEIGRSMLDDPALDYRWGVFA